MKSDLWLQELERIQSYFKASYFNKMFQAPLRLLKGAIVVFYKKVAYPFFRKEFEVNASLFFGGRMKVLLPASNDIYINKAKPHDSEIRLAKFIIRKLLEGDHFLDIGAHYGYFSLLASRCVGDVGKVISVEPSSRAYAILSHNVKKIDNTRCMNNAISNKKDKTVIYEFPNMYSEYNSLNQDQYKDQKWFQEYTPKPITVESTTIDTILLEEKLSPKIIKVDVEGAEFLVMQGAQQYLTSDDPYVVLEYVQRGRGHSEHEKALQYLQNYRLYPHAISVDGSITYVENVTHYLLENRLDSDNLVFKKGISN